MKYIPILRFGSIEAKILMNELNGQEIFPLLEMTKKNIIEEYSGQLRRTFKGNYMVELPIYLMTTLTKHTGEIVSILRSLLLFNVGN